MLGLPIHEQGVSLHLFKSLISCIFILKFSALISYTHFVRFIPKCYVSFGVIKKWLYCSFPSRCLLLLWRRKWQPILVSLPGKSHGQRSLAGYSPWGHKELDTTERLTPSLLCIKSLYFTVAIFFFKSKYPKSYSLLTILIFSCSNEGEFDFGSSQNQTSLWQIVFTCKTGWYLWRCHFNKSSFAWMLGLQKLVK